ncbi:SgcJ/EcaC family oxidoreductase [Micromonospora sp. WMMD558]|uniref:SgcJ/EcaC family oxidoreductase n=1 Tax=unclassified Micromonospora TaxID=2617518 RepID=UPI0012B4F32B|nr:SgcJ/EcaC family oxidoreductase [Micromonospora sp. WMMC415]QGN48298.1 SgcJ/EcaC family oxidoreductase [Micromonospora sp. WMMC415]
MPDDRTAVTSVIGALVDAWNRQDAEAYGRLFTEDATYVTWVGTHYRGRRDIVASHRALFTRFVKGTKLADEILDLRFFGPDTAVVTGRGEIYKGDRPGKLTKVQTYVLVRTADGGWRIAAFQNTKRKPLMEAVSFRFAPDLIPAGR